MAQILTRNWGWVVLRGVLAILFGIFAFIWPEPTLTILVALFGAYALVDGIIAIATGVSGGTLKGRSRWYLVVWGVAGSIVGLITFFYPDVTVYSLLYLIGAWAIVMGLFEVSAAIQLRQEIRDEWLLIIGGLLSVIFGVLVFVYPEASALSILWLVASYAIVLGITIVALGFRMRRVGATLASATTVQG